MPDLIVMRKHYREMQNYVIGDLCIGTVGNADKICNTLEPYDKQILPTAFHLAQRYPCVLFESPHFQSDVIRINNVTGRTNIEIHPGNTEADSRGCILVGYNTEKGKVLNSRDALKTLLSLFRVHNVKNIWIFNIPE